MANHNEDSRVKIPAILHLARLGYTYLSLKQAKRDTDTNIFTDIFLESVARLNPHLLSDDIQRHYEKLSLVLDNEDLGKEFYNMLFTSEVKIIDFDNLHNNSFHVVTELPCINGEDEFRPDITLLVNGMPLAFIEVKKPNNREGILAERKRIDARFQNKKFRKFINLTQLIVFSNNMEYDAESLGQIEGAFYSSTSTGKAIFNSFKEDTTVEKLNLDLLLAPENDELENFVLKDTNLGVIKHSPEFATNKNPDSPTNRILTSLFSKERLAFVLRYGLVYVDEHDGLQKHVMRYPQFFATKSIEQTIESGTKKGIIWHTQGSGKTALAYYNVKHLTDYFQKKMVVPKFYFIVDRLDLLKQAKKEFSARGLVVHTVSSKEELLKDFQKTGAITLSGKLEITVVNIQKFRKETGALNPKSYATNTQRVYFLDEVHRSYDPKGSFLANLMTSDREAIIIGLTGTPLIGEDRNSKATFGDYIHKYYYNASIADGYTLRLIREGIETNYKIQLQEALKKIEVLKGEIERETLYSHPQFVAPMLDYIVTDFEKSRVLHGDNTIGGMVVCDSSAQAKELKEQFDEKYAHRLSAHLILHDSGTKEEQEDWVENQFKTGKTDLLFVYQMLLTGFDAKRLKKLYLCRVVKKHGLLQTLTRVNRPYKDFHYGYVVDFADIRSEFDATNKAYFDELNSELGDELETYSNLFLSKEEIEKEIEIIKDKLFHFDLLNEEKFSQQISAITDKKVVLEIKKALGSAKTLYNLIRLLGHYTLLEKIDFKKLNSLYREADNRLNLLNLKESLESSSTTKDLLNVALEDVLFTFRKVSEEEMVIADQLKNTLKKTREELNNNIDKADKEFVKLYDELKRMFQKKNLDEITQDEMRENIGSLQDIYEAILDLNRRNNLLKDKYSNDEKFVRLHKRVMEQDGLNANERKIYASLVEVKTQADDSVLSNAKMLANEAYFSKFMNPIVYEGFNKNGLKLDPKAARAISVLATTEYIQQFTNTTHKW